METNRDIHSCNKKDKIFSRQEKDKIKLYIFVHKTLKHNEFN